MVLIITGHLRSGTSILKRLCDSHPDITLTLELGNFLCVGKPGISYMLRFLQRWGGIALRDWPLVGDSSQKHPYGKVLWENNLLVLRYLLYIARYWQKSVTLENIETALHDCFPHARIIGDKYPEYIFELDQLVKAEQLSLIVIYRDCRDVTSSTLKAVRDTWQRKLPLFSHKINTAEKVARRWVRAVELMERHKHNLHQIRYEDLVLNPEQVTASMGKWLGVDPTGFDCTLIKQDSQIGKYQHSLTPDELKTVMEIAGSMMRKLGYL